MRKTLVHKPAEEESRSSSLSLAGYVVYVTTGVLFMIPMFIAWACRSLRLPSLRRLRLGWDLFWMDLDKEPGRLNATVNAAIATAWGIPWTYLYCFAWPYLDSFHRWNLALVILALSYLLRFAFWNIYERKGR